MLDRAYDIGRRAAISELEKLASDPMEKEAFFAALKGLYQGSRALKSLGWLAGFGGRGSEWIGMPLGSGLLGAAFAEEGQGIKGFATGVAGGLAGTAAGKLGGKLLRGLSNRAGTSLSNTEFGKKVWSGAGNINRNYGANSLAKYQKELAEVTAHNKAVKVHNAANPSNLKKFKEVPTTPTVDVGHSFGQHAIKKLPAAAGLAGTIGGFLYGTGIGEDASSYAWDSMGLSPRRLGSIQSSNVFNPAG
jgi:hypothetical protein